MLKVSKPQNQSENQHTHTQMPKNCQKPYLNKRKKEKKTLLASTTQI